MEHVFASVCINMIDVSSASEMYTMSCGVWMSYICRLKSVRLRGEPYGNPLGKFLAADDISLNCMNASLPDKYIVGEQAFGVLV